MLNLYPNYIFWNKLLNQITVRKNKYWRYLPVNHISVKGMDQVPSKEMFSIRLAEMLGSFQTTLQNIQKDDKDTIVFLANETLEHRFDLLGSGPVAMPKINWHADFKSGHSWPKGWYYKKQRQASVAGSDIKVPWELSRCHHLLWLGEAYLLTKEERYSKEVVDEIENWLTENPLMYSVNWTCTMDVAIRAVNWLFAVAMIMESDVVTESFINKIYKSFYQHGWYIFNNLEKSVPYSNNHLFSDYAGLIYLAILFQNTKYGRKWKAYVIPEFYNEIRRQILPSGVHYERSVSYHRLMTELASYPCYLLKRMGYTIPSDIEYRVSSMYSFIATYTKDNGRAPLIEDNDDGRFLPFMRRDFRRHDYMLDPNSVENKLVANEIQLFGFEKATSRLYLDAGHAILRKGEAYLFVTNGGFSKYEDESKERGTHTHNDRLSFELAIGNDDVFVDPGAYIYTPDPEKYYEFHSTAKHNTIVVDGEEQNNLNKNSVFLLKKNSVMTAFEMESDTACRGGYRTLEQSMSHNRLFQLNEDCLTIDDEIIKAGKSHHAVLSYHLSPEVEARIADDIVEIETSSYLVKMMVVQDDKQRSLTIEDDTYSPSYGVSVRSKTVRVGVSFDESSKIQTKIQWQKKQ